MNSQQNAAASVANPMYKLYTQSRPTYMPSTQQPRHRRYIHSNATSKHASRPQINTTGATKEDFQEQCKFAIHNMQIATDPHGSDNKPKPHRPVHRNKTMGDFNRFQEEMSNREVPQLSKQQIEQVKQVIEPQQFDKSRTQLFPSKSNQSEHMTPSQRNFKQTLQQFVLSPVQIHQIQQKIKSQAVELSLNGFRQGGSCSNRINQQTVSNQSFLPLLSKNTTMGSGQQEFKSPSFVSQQVQDSSQELTSPFKSKPFLPKKEASAYFVTDHQIWQQYQQNNQSKKLFSVSNMPVYPHCEKPKLEQLSNFILAQCNQQLDFSNPYMIDSPKSNVSKKTDNKTLTTSVNQCLNKIISLSDMKTQTIKNFVKKSLQDSQQFDVEQRIEEDISIQKTWIKLNESLPKSNTFSRKKSSLIRINGIAIPVPESKSNKDKNSSQQTQTFSTQSQQHLSTNEATPSQRTEVQAEPQILVKAPNKAKQSKLNKQGGTYSKQYTNCKHIEMNTPRYYNHCTKRLMVSEEYFLDISRRRLPVVVFWLEGVIGYHNEKTNSFILRQGLNNKLLIELSNHFRLVLISTAKESKIKAVCRHLHKQLNPFVVFDGVYKVQNKQILMGERGQMDYSQILIDMQVKSDKLIIVQSDNLDGQVAGQHKQEGDSPIVIMMPHLRLIPSISFTIVSQILCSLLVINNRTSKQIEVEREQILDSKLSFIKIASIEPKQELLGHVTDNIEELRKAGHKLAEANLINNFTLFGTFIEQSNDQTISVKHLNTGQNRQSKIDIVKDKPSIKRQNAMSEEVLKVYNQLLANNSTIQSQIDYYRQNHKPNRPLPQQSNQPISIPLITVNPLDSYLSKPYKCSEITFDSKDSRQNLISILSTKQKPIYNPPTNNFSTMVGFFTQRTLLSNK